MKRAIIRPAIQLFAKSLQLRMLDTVEILPFKVKGRSIDTLNFIYSLVENNNDPDLSKSVVIGGSLVDNVLVIDIISDSKVRIVCTLSNLVQCLYAAQGIVRKGIVHHAVVRHYKNLRLLIKPDLSVEWPFASIDETTDEEIVLECDLVRRVFSSNLPLHELFRIAPNVLIDTLGHLATVRVDVTKNSNPISAIRNWLRFTDDGVVDHDLIVNEQLTQLHSSSDQSLSSQQLKSNLIINLASEIKYSVVVDIN